MFEKMSSRKYDVGAKSSVQGYKQLKEKPDAEQNKESGDIRVRFQPAKLPACERELKKSLSSKGKYQQHKADANVIEGEGQVLAPPSSRTWQLWPSGYGFRDKDTKGGAVVESFSVAKESH